MIALHKLYRRLFRRYDHWVAKPIGNGKYYSWCFWDDTVKEYRYDFTHMEAEDVVSRYPEMLAVKQ